jgi:hypothetical protein
MIKNVLTDAKKFVCAFCVFISKGRSFNFIVSNAGGVDHRHLLKEHHYRKII